MINDTPYESKEQIRFVSWLKKRKVRIFTCTLQDAPLGHKYRNQYKAMGLNGGLADMVICLEEYMTKDEKPHLVFVEMKRIKGGVESVKQKIWRRFINSVNGDVDSVIMKGRNQAVSYIDSMLKPHKDIDFTKANAEERERIKNIKIPELKGELGIKMNKVKADVDKNHKNIKKILPF